MLSSRKYYFIFTIIFVSFLTSCSLLQNHQTSNVTKRELASESWESYFDRPDILEVSAQEHAGLMSQWSDLKRAHIEAVAMFLEMYPDREIYFLARDSELLYDVARLALKHEPERLAKIHLLNISRANMRAENVQKYLAQEGISNETLEAGKKVLFIDTGFNGTIPRVLKEYFPAKYHKQLKTHLLCSSNPEHPSTRSFLVWLNSGVVNMYPGNMHGTIIGYEHMPRYTDRSSKFEFRQGRWHPVSTAISSSDDGQVSKDLAQKYMEDLKNYFDNENVQEILKSRRSFWGNVKNTPKEELNTLLKNSLSNASEQDKKFILSAIRDLNEMNQGSLKIEEFGLKIVPTSSLGPSKKNELIKIFPEWKSILENPDDEIKKLFMNQDLSTLGKMIDTIKDSEIITLIASALGKSNNSFNTKIIDLMILKKDSYTLLKLVQYTFSQPQTKDITNQLTMLIKAAVDLKDISILQNLQMHTFSQPHTKDFIKEKALIKNFLNSKNWEELKAGMEDKVATTLKLEIETIDKNIGNIFNTDKNRQIKILSFIDQGKRGRVYKVEDVETKKFYALKMAIDQNPETLESFAKELTKNSLYKKYGAPHANILESSPNMILKEWIEGVRADEFFKKWEGDGALLDAPELIALKDFVAKLASMGIYIGDLNAKNLIWSNHQWIIVDSGGIKEGLSHEMALAEYLQKIPLKMGKHLSSSCQDSLKVFFKP